VTAEQADEQGLAPGRSAESNLASVPECRTVSMVVPMVGYAMSKDDYLNRLARIEGQVRGLRRQVEEDTYCIDVLTQISATSAALRSLAVGLLDEHIRHCVTEAAIGDDQGEADRKVTEATKAIERLVRS
jgi:DNA-binding FrmR family transcriptional regulator